MSEKLYFITVDNHTVAENVSIEYALIFIRAISESYYNEDNIVIAISPMGFEHGR